MCELKMTSVINSESDFFKADDFRSIMACSAKQDVRYYLISICLCNRYEKPMIVATNGHVLLAIDEPKVADIVDKGEHIIISPFNIKGSCHFINIEKQGDELIASLLDKRYGVLERIFLKAIDARYPDIGPLLDSVEVDNNLEGGVIGITPKYLGSIDKIFRSNAVVMKFNGCEGAIKITSTGLPNYRLVVMPARIY
jgi:DNA polymerase III sliding clamp (beta) subunit (PCNA family)